MTRVCSPAPRRSLALLGAATLLACGQPGSADPDAGGGSTADTDDTELPVAAPIFADPPALDELPPGPWDLGVPLPADPQVLGDPVEGRRALLDDGYVGCGIPRGLFGLLRPILGDHASGPPLPGRAAVNADVPYNWTVHTAPSGVEIVSQNCLQCHAGRFNGELVVGLGDVDTDYTRDMSALLRGAPALGLLGGQEELARFVQRVEVVGPASVTRTVGTNPAEMITFALMQHLDPQTLRWSDAPLRDGPQLIAPSDVPPWWRAHKKHALFHNGMARGDHRGSLMLASSLCIDGVDEARRIAAAFDDIYAYIRSLRAPAYPFAIDAALASEGRAVFDSQCAGCHGTYAADDADETYPNLLLPLDVIGTDPVIAEYMPTYAPGLLDWFRSSFFGAMTRMEPAAPVLGYVAPPLDGVWATAPFLHNGSVPTIELVLDSTQRPTYWRRVDHDSADFDEDALGWPFERLPYGQADAPADARKHVYDTTQFAHGNGGHTFGDHLTPDERRAVLEYLKTL